MRSIRRRSTRISSTSRAPIRPIPAGRPWAIALVSWGVWRGWNSPDSQYYWNKLDLNVLPRDESWVTQVFTEALTLARRGDASARHHLTRLIHRDPDTDQARAAAAILRESEA